MLAKSPKTKAGQRAISLSPLVVSALKVHKKQQNEERVRLAANCGNRDLVLCHEDGTPWHPGSFTAEWKKTTEALGLKANFHKLRHTMATLMLMNGSHMKVVQERLGHSAIGITMDTYSHLVPSMQAEAAKHLDATLSTALAEARKGKS